MTTKQKPLKQDLREVREYHTPSFGLFFKTKKFLYGQTSPYQKIEVIENEDYGRVLLLDGLVQTTERDEFFYHEMLAHPACVSHPAPQNLLIIGGGDGGALKEVLRYPVKQVSLVEIDAQVIEVSKEFFPWLRPSLEDKRTKLVVADGNEFIQNREEKFDVILIDSSDPVGPSTCLHQSDFYKKLRRCLNPKGVVAAQAGSLLYHLEHMREKNDFLKKIFKVVRFYLSPVPTYPGGNWCYVFLSDEIDPLVSIVRKPPSGLKYYNLDIHRAAFALPNFLLGTFPQEPPF